MEESFLELNSNLLETNLINILLLLALLIYAYKVSFSLTLEKRRKDIITAIENGAKDVNDAKNYYYLSEKGFSQSFFWLQSWKSIYETEKTELVERKYNQIKTSLGETFNTSENLMKNFESKSFLSLQRFILFLTASRILRKFFVLSEFDQSKLIETTITKLEGMKK
jgi:F0F1-type ATP synthase membrane subunit b/b'